MKPCAERGQAGSGGLEQGLSAPISSSSAAAGRGGRSAGPAVSSCASLGALGVSWGK